MRLAEPVYADRIAVNTQEKFGGLRHMKQAKDGEIFDMANLSSDAYPLLQTRKKRWSRPLEGAGAKVYGFCVIDGEFVWSADDITNCGATAGQNTSHKTSAGIKRYARLNRYVVVMPDKVYFRRGKNYYWESGNLELKQTTKEGYATLKDGTLAGVPAAANTLRIADVEAQKHFDGLEVGDTVTISGCSDRKNDVTAIIREIEFFGSNVELRFDENLFSIPEGSTVDGTDNSVAGYQEPNAVTVCRTVPDMDGVFEHDNRLWGYKGSAVYCSKLGNPFVWNTYDGTATASWSTDVLSEGDITGGCSYGGYPTFFKENSILKVYGSIPSEFRVSEVTAHGIKEGCDLTAAEAEGALFYLSPVGVCAYTGGMPTVVSREAFDDDWLVSGTAGSDGQCYHISAETCDGERVMLVYDVANRVWHREDDLQAIGWGHADDTLYCMDPVGTVWGTRKFHDIAVEEGAVVWSVEFGDFAVGTTRKKAVSKIEIRAAVSGSMGIYISYDGGKWKKCYTVNAISKKTVTVPIRPHRSDHFRLKLTGEGECTVYSIATYQYVGSSK